MFVVVASPRNPTAALELSDYLMRKQRVVRCTLTTMERQYLFLAPALLITRSPHYKEAFADILPPASASAAMARPNNGLGVFVGWLWNDEKVEQPSKPLSITARMGRMQGDTEQLLASRTVHITRPPSLSVVDGSMGVHEVF